MEPCTEYQSENFQIYLLKHHEYQEQQGQDVVASICDTKIYIGTERTFFAIFSAHHRLSYLNNSIPNIKDTRGASFEKKKPISKPFRKGLLHIKYTVCKNYAYSRNTVTQYTRVLHINEQWRAAHLGCSLHSSV